MKLTTEQLRCIAWGAVRVEEEDGGACFHRFTKEQQELYRVSNTDFYDRSKAPAGVRLVFRTDSRSMTLRVHMNAVSTRTLFSFDVFVNGVSVGALDNFSDIELPDNYAMFPRELGAAEKTFDLGEGEKLVMIHLPWGVRVVMNALELDDGAMMEPVAPPEKKLMTYGDSITHGYDSQRPCNRYATLLANSFEAEEFCKAIGGEIFFPELAELRDDFEPDYISVAYGTNDWGKVTADKLNENCAAFLGALSRNYPNAKIFVLTPIWRKDTGDFPERFDFMQIPDLIRKAAEPLPNVTVLYGFDFVPKDSSYYADLRLHPNDKGFAEYHKNLWKAIQEHL